MAKNQRIKEIFYWLQLDHSIQEDEVPIVSRIMRALDEMILNFTENGNLEKANYLRTQSVFYSKTLELLKETSPMTLKGWRIKENTRFSPAEQEKIQWEVAEAYYMEEVYENACLLLNGGKADEGITLLDVLVEKGHYNAALQRAYWCILTEQYMEALVRLKILINRRPNEFAYILLGDLYLPEAGKEGDPDIACAYYEKAADMGVVAAMQKVAEMNFYGQISEPSFVKASLLYEQAADTGDPACTYMSGICNLYRERSGDDCKPEDLQMWNRGIERLKQSQDPRSKPMLYYAERRLPHQEELKLFRLPELYEKLRQEEKKELYIYRGQTRVYPSPLRPSAYRNCRYSRYAMRGEPACQMRNWGQEFYLEDTDLASLREHKKAHAVKRIISQYVNNALGYPLTQAFFQQAGYSSEGLDVSYDLRIALFFALYEFKNGKYVKKEFGESKPYSVLYRWKLPENRMSLQDNYYSKAHFIPTYDIFRNFSVCDSVEESRASLKRYLKAIRWGSIDFDLPANRPFELIKVPSESLLKSRIAMQKGALLIPDVIQGYQEQRQHIAWGHSLGEITKLEFRLVQDLAGPSICDTFLIDCGHQEDLESLGLKLPKPEEIYDEDREDITHILTHDIFEQVYEERMKLMGTSFLELNPAMPGYGISYQEVLHQLDKWNRGRDNSQYRFE